jgi:hypothetical protein
MLKNRLLCIYLGCVHFNLQINLLGKAAAAAAAAATKKKNDPEYKIEQTLLA